MKLSEIRYNIWNILSGGRTTDNEYYSGKQIDFQIHYYRSLLIRRQAERQRRLREFEQSISSFPVDLYESGDKFDVYKSKHKLPRTIRLVYNEPLTLVNDSKEQIQVSTHHRQGWDYYSKYSHIKPKAYLQNDYLFVESYKKLRKEFEDSLYERDDGGIDFSNTKELEKFINSGREIVSVNIQGIFENPVEFEKLKAKVEDYQYSDDFEYPIGADNVQQLTQSILQGEGQTLIQVPSDMEHNNLPDRDILGRQSE